MKPVQRFLLALLMAASLSGCVGTQTRSISREEARVVLTRFVNQELERKTLAEANLPREGRLAWPRLLLQDWRFLEFSKGRWEIATEPQPPGTEYTGIYVRASVDEFGGAPELEAARIYLP